MKKRKATTLKVVIALVVSFLLFSQGCMTMRMKDSRAYEEFKKAGVPISLKYAEAAGWKIHYAQTGDDSAATLFFVHGSPGSWDAFKKYLQDPDLLGRYRMVSIDRPGFGYSGYGKGISITDQSVILGALIANLQNGKPFFIVGHSLGGPLCVKLAAYYPQNITGVLLLAASVAPGEEKAERWRPFFRVPPLRWLFPGAFKPSNDELWYFKKDVKSMPDDLQRIVCPVTIMQGLKDPLVPPGNAYYAQKQLIHSAKVKLITIEDANHFIPWTRYVLVKDALMHLND